jgi:hypothetical protein
MHRPAQSHGLDQQAHDEAAQHVDDKRAPGKIEAEQAPRSDADEIAPRGAKRAASRYT